jgi:hypothetical protein
VELLEIIEVVWREGKLDFTGGECCNLALRPGQQEFVVDIETIA